MVFQELSRWARTINVGQILNRSKSTPFGLDFQTFQDDGERDDGDGASGATPNDERIATLLRLAFYT